MKPNDETIEIQNQPTVEYTDENIRHLSDMEHVRTRPGMYIGRLGDGSLPEDGIYVLLKEVIDNSIDEFKMNAGKRIEVDIDENLRVAVRDYGRGIPQGKLVEAVSVLNTGGKYDSKAFKKSVGLNGVGVKAVNALSSHFEVKSYREGKVRELTFECGIQKSDKTSKTTDENGTYIFFEPDNTLFKGYQFQNDIVETMLRNYTYLNTGLTIMYNGRRIVSRNGLKDLLTDKMTTDSLYPIVHMKGGGHRDCLYAYQPIWRGIPLLRQRTAYHTGRYAPKCVQRTYCQNHQGVFRKIRAQRHPQRYRGCYRHQCGRTCLRKSDEDKTGFYAHGSWRRYHQQICGRLHQATGG